MKRVGFLLKVKADMGLGGAHADESMAELREVFHLE
jgi:hypothetical protein